MNVTPSNGFTGTVNFSVTGLPSGATASFTPASVAGSGSTTLSVNTASSTPTGTSTLTITATSGTLTHTAQVTLVVAQPAASVSATPSSQTVAPAAGTSYTVNVTPSTGFTGTVNFSVTGLPSGATASFTPASVAGSGSTTLSRQHCEFDTYGHFYSDHHSDQRHADSHSTSDPGCGTTGRLLRLGHTPFPDRSSRSRHELYGERDTLQRIHRNRQFQRDWVAFGCDCQFTPASVAGSGSTTLSVNTASSTPTGTSTLTITATSGTLTHTAQVTLVVAQPADFSVSATPPSRTVAPAAGTSYTVNVTPSNGFTGTVNFSVTGLPSGATASFTPASVAGSGSTTLSVNTASSTPTGTSTLTITATSGTLTHTAQVTLVVAQPADFSVSATPPSRTVAPAAGTSYTVNVTPSNGFTGTVNFSVTGLPSGATASFTPASVAGSGSTTLSVNTASSTPTGTSTLTITATSGTLTHTAQVTLVVAQPADFSVSATPPSRTVAPTAGTSYTVNVTPSNGFTGTVNFSVTGLPSGATASFTPASVAGSGSTTLSVNTASSTPTGTSTLTITATSGTLTHTAQVTLVVAQPADFSVSATPPSRTVAPAAGTSYTVNVTPSNGFTGTVNFSVTGLPSGATASFTPASVAGSGSTTLSVNTASSTPTGTSTLTITATSGTLTHTAQVTLVVAQPADFSVSATPSSRTVAPAAGTSYTVNVTPSNGFTGTVNFSVTGLPSGATASFSPSSVAGSGSSNLSLNTSSSTPGGTYPLTITATSGSLVHSTQVTLTVADFSMVASPSSRAVHGNAKTTYTVTVTALGSFSASVNFSLSGLPTRTTALFSPTSVVGSGNTTLTISSKPRTPHGTYTLTITGTGGGLTHSTNVSLVVQ